MNDIDQILLRKVSAAMYADDLAIWCSEESVGTTKIRLQETMDNLAKWTDQWAMSINAQKTTYTIFSMSTKPQKILLTINGQILPKDETPTYLGVTFDPRLTWKQHIDKCQTKGTMRTALLKKLAGTDWGANGKILSRAYTGYVRPALEYGMSAWGTAAKSNTQKTSKIQNRNLRIITGGMNTTPITEMETCTGLPSMEERKNEKILTQYAKFKCLESHQMNQRLSRPTKERLKEVASYTPLNSFRNHSQIQTYKT